MKIQKPMMTLLSRNILPCLLSGLLTLSLAGVSVAAPPAKAKPAAPAVTSPKPAAKPEAAKPAANAVPVAPLDLVKEPAKYMDKDIAMEGTFNRFSDMALDYKKAFKDSREFVSFLILRPDVKKHSIPLSELKLFYPRKKSDEVVELESGDVISIKGHVFSTALNEPWVDVSELKIVKKTPDSKKKPASATSHPELGE